MTSKIGRLLSDDIAHFPRNCSTAAGWQICKDAHTNPRMGGASLLSKPPQLIRLFSGLIGLGFMQASR